MGIFTRSTKVAKSNHLREKESSHLLNLRTPSDYADLLDPLERLRQQREQIPPAPHNILQQDHPQTSQNSNPSQINHQEGHGRRRQGGTNRTSSWPARDTFSFLKTDVSKSSDGMVAPITCGDETLAATAPRQRGAGGGGEGHGGWAAGRRPSRRPRIWRRGLGFWGGRARWRKWRWPPPFWDARRGLGCDCGSGKRDSLGIRLRVYICAAMYGTI